MDRTPPRMTQHLMVSRTHIAKQRVEDTLRRAREIESDMRRMARRESQNCKACFYFPAMGGAAITTQPCMSCGRPEQYGSTNTDALCLACAQESGLCKHCGGNLEMHERRRQWPEPKQ